MKKTLLGRDAGAGLIMALPPLAAVAAGFILPYGAAVRDGLSGLEHLRYNPRLIDITVFTVKQALLSTGAALILGLPGAWFLALAGDREAKGLRLLSGIPFAMPSILVMLGFVLFFGNAGWLNRLLAAAGWKPLRLLYKPEAIILAHAFYNFPLVIRLAGDGLRETRKAYAQTAASLGGSPVITFGTVLLPLALPSLGAACLLVFLYSFTSFALVLVLGGGPAASTLAVEIYRYARIALDYSSAGTLALIETIIAGGVFALYLVFERQRVITLETRERRLEQLQSPLFRAGMIFYFVVIFCFIGGPLLSIPVESFLFKPSRAGPPEFSLRYWTGIADSVLPSLGRSVGLAVLSASLSCGFGILAAGGLRNIGKETPGSARIIRFCMASPLVSSGIVLGLGWLRLYGRENARNIWAAALVHGLTALPFVFNSLSRGLDSLDDTALKAAEIAGAGPMLRIITVAIPCAFQRLRSAWGIAAALSLGELNAVMMLGIENWETLPLLIYRAAGSYRYGVACAAGSALILCCGAVFGISEFRFPRKKHIP